MIQSRLNTINPILNKIILNSKSFNESKDIFFNIYDNIIKLTNINIIKKLIDVNIILDDMTINLSFDNNLQKKIESFDENYFDLEDKEKYEESDVFFKSARIASGVNFLLNAIDHDGIADAVYEILMSLDNPQEFHFNLQN